MNVGPVAEGQFDARPDDILSQKAGDTTTATGPAGSVDVVEVALARSLEAATAAREWTVVGQLARELAERRLEGRRQR